MHELGITENIIEIIKRNTPEGARVTKARLEIGKLTGFVPDSIRFYFEAITKGTPLEGADLDIEETPSRMICDKCNTEFEVIDLTGICPKCGAWPRILSGRELLVKSIEVD